MSPNYFIEQQKQSIIECNQAINKLNQLTGMESVVATIIKVREALVESVKSVIPLNEMVTHGTWIINKFTNTYYQYIGLGLTGKVTYLKRNGVDKPIDTEMFNRDYRLADASEVKQHLEFLVSKRPNIAKVIIPINCYKVKHDKDPYTPTFDPMKCDFYMVTCRGIRGAKVRHTSYAEAEKEAMKIAKSENHETWIVGVVASVKPVVEVTVKVSKR